MSKTWGMLVGCVLLGCGSAGESPFDAHDAPPMSTSPEPVATGGATTYDASTGGAGGDATSASAAGGVPESTGGMPAATGGVENSDDAASPAADGGPTATGGAPSAGGQGMGGTGGTTSCTALFYRDVDNDGFGDPKVSLMGCTRPAGYVTNADDCMDSNASVHPGAKGGTKDRGDGSFDFDCDGKETPALTTFAACAKIDNSCPPPSQWTTPNQCDYLGMAATAVADGWSPCWTVENCDVLGNCGCNPPDAIPPCGVSGSWGAQLTWSKASGYACTTHVTNATRTQSCR